MVHPTPTNRELTNEQMDAIRSRAYELFEDRGREDGHALEDWLMAREEVMAKSLSASA